MDIVEIIVVFVIIDSIINNNNNDVGNNVIIIILLFLLIIVYVNMILDVSICLYCGCVNYVIVGVLLFVWFKF